MLGFGTLSVLILQGLAAISIVVYFRRAGDPRWWSTFIAPGIGFLGIAAISVLAIVNFDIVAGSEELAIRLMPLLLVLAVIGGIVYGAYLKRPKPAVYDGLATDLERFTTRHARDAARTSPNGASSRPRRRDMTTHKNHMTNAREPRRHLDLAAARGPRPRLRRQQGPAQHRAQRPRDHRRRRTRHPHRAPLRRHHGHLGLPAGRRGHHGRGRSDTDDYEAFEVDDDLYFVQFHHGYLPNEAVSLSSTCARACARGDLAHPPRPSRAAPACSTSSRRA